MRVNHNDICELLCTDNDKTATAEVLNFREGDGLTVALVGNKIVMKYVKQHDIYVGSMAGMEFTTKGPKIHNTQYRR